MKTSKMLIFSSFFFLLFTNLVMASTGCIRGDCTNGHGTFKWPSGNEYTGTFKNGSRDGQGVFLFTNGDKYIGEFKQGKRTGIGTYFFADGSKYEGEYIDGIRNGFGIFTLTNNARYEGEYKNGNKHGFGKFIFPDGSVMNGSWEEGNFVEARDTARGSSKKESSFSLTVNTFPAESTVKLHNSPAAYEPGVKLPVGRYKVEVSHADYKTKTEYVDITNSDLIVPITLQIEHVPQLHAKAEKIMVKDETAAADSTDKEMVRGVELDQEDTTFYSLFREKVLGSGNDEELQELNEQRIETALQENDNAQKLSMIEQVEQELEMLKASLDPKLLSIKELPGSNNSFDRIALVIGNSQYPLIGTLKNPENDAKDVADALRKLGFNVTLKLNVDQQEMESAIVEFGERIKQDSLSLFYFAGHGVQIDGKNYLIPVQAGIKQAKDIRYKAVDLNMLIDEMVYAENGKNIIILDSCRNNPLPKGEGRRAAAVGLARTDAPAGTLIAYATSPGSVAIDGEGRNGIYTKYLLQNLFTPGLPVEILFKRVLQGVASETERRQIPWMSSSLFVDFVFASASSDKNAKQ